MSVYEFKVKKPGGEEVGLDIYKGKVMLIMNSATECGFTPQYGKLQDLYERYESDDFVILDFPCNQFGSQAPGSSDEITLFCESKFGVTFPIFDKIEVNGENAHPLYQYLVKQKDFEGFDEGHPLTAILDGMLIATNHDYKEDSSIKWNFTKFLVDRNGEVVARFEPTKDLAIVEEKIKELI